MDVVGKIMKTKSNLLAKASKQLLGLAAVVLSVSAMPAHAAKFGVRVVDDLGQPVVGASVCIGLQGNSKQFGATFTDARGVVMVDVPNVPLIVTVSKDRFTGIRTSEPARGFNLIKEFTLKSGVPGPRCRAGSVLAEQKAAAPNIVVTDIAVNAGSGPTTLSPTVSGQPNQYRVSADDSFTDSEWENYTSQISLASGLSNSEKVFLQMRKIQGSATAFLESRSEVLTIRLN